MDAAASCPPRPSASKFGASTFGASELRASELLLAHCAALEPGRGRPTARMRLDTVLGPELARRLLFALSTRR